MKMKRQIITVFFIISICMILAIPAFASSELHPERIVDYSGLLTTAEQISLEEELDSISEKQQFDVAVVIVDSTEGESIMDFADDFYDYNGYGMGENNSGLMLVIAMDTSKWYITSTGDGVNMLTSTELDNISEQFLPYLSDGEYADAFSAYANACDNLITRTINGDDYDKSLSASDFLIYIPIAAVIGFIPAIIGVSIMKGKLKSVRSNHDAFDYVKHDSLNITSSNDIFLYSHVATVAKPKDNDSSGGVNVHTSSSGTTHGGGGGSF